MMYDREEWGMPFGCAPVLCCGVLAAVMCGCLGTTPAARSNRNETHVTFKFGDNNRVKVALGDGLYASADAKDTSGETITATPTQTISPRVDVPAAISPLTAGIQAGAEVAKEAVKAAAKGSGSTGTARTTQDCPGGACSL